MVGKERLNVGGIVFGENLFCPKCGMICGNQIQCDCFRKTATQILNEEDIYYELSKLLGQHGWGYVNPDEKSILHKLEMILEKYDEMDRRLKDIRSILYK